jgi:hypothetical protein
MEMVIGFCQVRCVRRTSVTADADARGTIRTDGRTGAER